MTTLTEFLLARIGEDEAVAREAGLAGSSWVVEKPSRVRRSGQYPRVAEPAALEAAHIARHDPARVLAECEAKRRIVEAYEACGGPTDEERERLARDHPRAAQYGHPEWYEGQAYGLAEAVQNLAALYADHPDYCDQWAT